MDVSIHLAIFCIQMCDGMFWNWFQGSGENIELDFHKGRVRTSESLEEQIFICNDIDSIENLLDVLEEVEKGTCDLV